MLKFPSKFVTGWGAAVALLGIVGIGAVWLFSPFGESWRGRIAGARAEGMAKSASGKMTSAASMADQMKTWKDRIAAAGPKNFADLMREIMRIGDPALREKVATALVAKWVSVDLTGFIAFVDAAEVDDDGDADSLWALLAPALANALPTLSDEAASRPELTEVVRRLIEYSARQDPERALVWAKQWLMDDTLESALATIAGEMIKKSPEEALKVFQDIHSPVRRVDAIGAIAAVYGTTHPEEATTWAKTLENRAERPYAMNAVLAARAEVEPEAASKEFVDFREATQAAYSTEREAEITRMGMSDIKEHKDGEPLTPEEAMDSEVLPGKDDPQLGLLEESAKAIAENWAANDPAKAMQWSESLPAGRLREEVVQSALAGWASKDPEAAYAYYMKNDASVAEPAQPIFEAWAGMDPTRAAAQADQLSDPAIREKAVSGVVSGWIDSSSDRSALNAWVDKLPNPWERDEANAQIAEAASYDEPTTAWQRATAIQSQSERREALKSAFASLVESDPSQARATLAQAKNNLTSDETNRLTKMLNAVTAANASN